MAGDVKQDLWLGGIKAYAIGIDVLEKPDDFDPTTDPIAVSSPGGCARPLRRFTESDAGVRSRWSSRFPWAGQCADLSPIATRPVRVDLEADGAGVEIEHKASFANIGVQRVAGHRDSNCTGNRGCDYCASGSLVRHPRFRSFCRSILAVQTAACRRQLSKRPAKRRPWRDGD